MEDQPYRGKRLHPWKSGPTVEERPYPWKSGPFRAASIGPNDRKGLQPRGCYEKKPLAKNSPCIFPLT
jgi:hypothetical protein